MAFIELFRADKNRHGKQGKGGELSVGLDEAEGDDGHVGISMCISVCV